MYISEFDIIFLFYETVLTWCRDYPYYCDIIRCSILSFWLLLQ